jgi:hypothetical protein
LTQKPATLVYREERLHPGKSSTFGMDWISPGRVRITWRISIAHATEYIHRNPVGLLRHKLMVRRAPSSACIKSETNRSLMLVDLH